jgi:hypothetical protein
MSGGRSTVTGSGCDASACSASHLETPYASSGCGASLSENGREGVRSPFTLTVLAKTK